MGQLLSEGGVAQARQSTRWDPNSPTGMAWPLQQAPCSQSWELGVGVGGYLKGGFSRWREGALVLELPHPLSDLEQATPPYRAWVSSPGIHPSLSLLSKATHTQEAGFPKTSRRGKTGEGDACPKGRGV